MTESIVVALISSGITGIATIATILSSNKKSTNLLTYRMEQLEIEVRKHNGFDKRIHCVEKDVGILFNNQQHLAEKLKEKIS